MLLWSDRSGLYARDLDAEGEGRNEARRVGVACPGGIDAAVAGPAVVVACAIPADRDRGRPGEILVWRLRGERSRLIARAATLGAESFGVSIAADGDRVVVGWRDADVFTARARFAEVRGRTLEPETLSTERTLASAPSLMFHDGALLSAWTESWIESDGLPAGHLFVRRDADAPVASLDVGEIGAHVELTSDDRGPIVSLHDRRPRGRPARAFTGRLDRHLSLTLEHLRSPLRAEASSSRPSVVSCGGHPIALATRETSREVTMVTLRRLDDELRSEGREHQIYEYHARFPHAVAACVGDRLMIAVGEQASEVEPVPRLRTFTLGCGPGVAHERTPAIEGQVLRKRGGPY
jgi:hypothetical protein